MASLPKIPTPWKQQWRRIRYQLVPVATMGLAVLFTAWLWKRHVATVNGVGEVSVAQADVVSNRDGMLVKLPRQLLPFTSVRRNELIAKLDHRPVVESIMSLRKEAVQLRSSLPKPPIATPPTTRPTDPAGLAIYRERQRLTAIDAAAQLLLDCIDQSDEEGAVRAKLKEVRRAMKVVDLAQPDPKSPLPENIEQPLNACRAEINAIEARLGSIEGEVEALRVYSPMDGMVTGVYRYPNQAVRAGETIATITSAEGQQVVSYVRQEQGFEPIPGMEVEVHPRIPGRKSSYGYIKHVGPKVESVPHKQLRDPKIAEWGIPVIIEVPSGALNLRPGQLVGLKYKLGD